MKIFLENSAQNFYSELKFIEKIIDIFVSDSADNAISIAAEKGDKLCVQKSGNFARITYSFTAEFFRGILILFSNKDKTDFEIT